MRLTERFSMRTANPVSLPQCCVWFALVVWPRSWAGGVWPPLSPCCHGHLLQGMTGGTIGGIVVADLILGRHEQGGV